MAKLYELTQEFNQLYEMMLENDDAEIEQVILDTIEGLEGEFDIKAEGYAKVIRQLDSDAVAYKAEKERLEKMEKIASNRSKWLKERLKDAMVCTGKTKIETDLFKISVQKNGGKLPLVFSIPEDDIPVEYRVQKWSTDNDKIREELKAGKELPFAKLGEAGNHVVIK